MLAKSFCSLVRAAAGALAAGLMFAALAAPAAQAATVNEFLANPTQVMAQYPNGGPELIALVRDVATSHPEALATLAALLSSGTADQQAAVGAGLGAAYKIVLGTDQAYAAQIQAAVAATDSDSAKIAYAAASGNNVSTASTSPGGGAGAGGGGGSGGTAGGGSGSNAPSGGSNSGSSGTTGQGSTQNSGNTFTGGGGGVSGSSSSGSSGSVSSR